MSKRLNQEREAKLQPVRLSHDKQILEQMGFIVEEVDETHLRFMYKGHPVSLWPYSGWHSGKTVKDGRGFALLLAQLEARHDG